MLPWVIAVLIGAVGCSRKGGEEEVLDGKAKGEIALGQELYERNGCPLCHGDRGRGDGRIAAALNPRPRDFRDLQAYQQGYTLEAISSTIKKGMASGKGVMPAYPHIAREQRRLIASYIVAMQADTAAQTLSITNPWIRESLPPHSQTAAYMTIANQGSGEEVLTGVEAPIASRVEIHLSYEEGEVMKMKKLEGISIPAGANVALQPGGLHLMLLDLEERLEAGALVELTLHFLHAGPWPLRVPVRVMEK